jgi:hypothetical protein
MRQLALMRDANLFAKPEVVIVAWWWANLLTESVPLQKSTSLISPREKMF